MKRYVFNETQIRAVILLLNKIEIKGIEQAKIMVSITNVLDNGAEEDVEDEEKVNEEKVNEEKAE